MNVTKRAFEYQKYNLKRESGIFCKQINEKTFGASDANLNSRDISQRVFLKLLKLRNTFLKYLEKFVPLWAPNCVQLEIIFQARGDFYQRGKDVQNLFQMCRECQNQKGLQRLSPLTSSCKLSLREEKQLIQGHTEIQCQG